MNRLLSLKNSLKTSEKDLSKEKVSITYKVTNADGKKITVKEMVGDKKPYDFDPGFTLLNPLMTPVEIEFKIFTLD